MGKRTQYTPLPDRAYDVRVTNLRGRPFNAPGSATGPGVGGVPMGTDAAGMPIMARGPNQWSNRNVSNTTPVLLPANQTSSQRVLPANPIRTGLIIANKDPTSTINVSFGNDAGLFGVPIGPGVVMLLDFTTPADSVYLINGSAANVQAVVTEIVRAG